MPSVSALFDLKYGHSLELNKLIQSESRIAINFVSRTARNNGVSARVEPINKLQPAEAGTISVALNGEGGAAQSFLQPLPYYCGFHVMILTPKSEMTENEKLWWAVCISANKYPFGFGRQANRTLKDILLPDDVPSWIKDADFSRLAAGGSEAAQCDKKLPLRDPTRWASYELQDLFSLKKGKRLTKANAILGSTPFIGAIDSRNGVTGFVRQKAIHAANTITVNYNGSVAEAFFQPNPFWCSDDVNVLYPKFSMTPAIALFVATIIRLERYRFNYGRKWHLERMRTSVIKLPPAANGNPDWEYMEAYVNGLPFSSKIAPC